MNILKSKAIFQACIKQNHFQTLTLSHYKTSLDKHFLYCNISVMWEMVTIVGT